MGKTSAAVKNRYNDKAYDRINLTVKKGGKQAIQDAATAKGESINGYIKGVLKTQIRADTGDDIEL